MSFFESSPKRPRLSASNHSDEDGEEVLFNIPRLSNEGSGSNRTFSNSYGTSSESEYSSSDREGEPGQLHTFEYNTTLLFIMLCVYKQKGKKGRHRGLVRPSFFNKGGDSLSSKGFTSKSSFKSSSKTSHSTLPSTTSSSPKMSFTESPVTVNVEPATMSEREITVIP
ncbi:hypothetical protein EON64_18765, partial [archaeon]